LSEVRVPSTPVK